MSWRTAPATLVVLLLTLAGVLSSLRYFLPGDLAALLGALAILLAMLLAGLLFLYLRGNTKPDGGEATPAELSREWAQDPEFRHTLHRAMLATEMACGLWMGFIAPHPWVTLPAYCLMQVAFHGLLGTMPKRFTFILGARLGMLTASALIGAGLRAAAG